MNTGETFRLGCPTLGIQIAGAHPEAVMIPAGALIRIAGTCFEVDRLVDCLWDGHAVTLFADDIRERGMRVLAAR